MTRVTTNEVKAVIDTELSDPDITTHIGIASRYVDELLVGKGLSEARLKDIELYLSAHFIAIRDQDAGQVSRQQVMSTTVDYGGDLGTALSFTRYGQQALALDTSGTLSVVGKSRAAFRVFG